MDQIRNCRCGALPGEIHNGACDMERCCICGRQAIACDCVYIVNGMNPQTLEEDHPTIYKDGPTPEMDVVRDAAEAALGGRIPWSGFYPGTLECIALGWYAYWGPGWVRCNGPHPGCGSPECGADLNRFVVSTSWDKERRCYLYKGQPILPLETA